MDKFNSKITIDKNTDLAVKKHFIDTIKQIPHAFTFNNRQIGAFINAQDLFKINK